MKSRTITDLITDLEAIKEEHGDLNLVYSRDEEGNSFDYVYFSPSVGHFADRDFSTYEFMDEGDDRPVNAVCIN